MFIRSRNRHSTQDFLFSADTAIAMEPKYLETGYPMIVIASSSLQLRHQWRCWLDDDYQVQNAVNSTMLEIMLQEVHAEMLLLDLASAGLGGIKGISKLCRLYPNLPVIVLSAVPSPEEELTALKAGARGYCNQSIGAELLRKAIKRVQQGEVWVTRKLIPSLIEEVAALHQRGIKDSNSLMDKYLSLLTPREREIAALIAQGDNNKIIARKLNITERTVKAHLSEIFRKLRIPDRLQLALLMHGHTPSHYRG